MTQHPTAFRPWAQALQGPLPGPAAQQTMAPSVRRNDPQADARAVREAGVLLLLYVQRGVLHMPLIVRPAYDGPHGGQVAFPGGRREPGDPDLWRTALRETEEEIGVRSGAIRKMGALSPIFIPNSRYQVSPFVGCVEGVPVFRPDAAEVSQVLPVPVPALLDGTRRQRETWRIRGQEVDVPFFAFGKHKIWGATAMILAEFLCLQTK